MPKSTDFKRNWLTSLAALILALATPAQVFAADAATDEQVAALRQFFRETEHGRPGLAPEQIDVRTLGQIYAHDNAVASLHRILSNPSYGSINERIGQLRREVILATASRVASERGVVFELNDAGTQLGGLSDSDQTVFIDTSELQDSAAGSPDSVHAELLDALVSEWKRPFSSVGDLAPIDFDVEFISGAGMLKDWRMTQAEGVSSFVAQLDADISRLSATRGVYFVPGGYKPMVYTRYYVEGRTVMVGPSLEGTASDLESHVPILGAEDLPDGIAIREGSTRELSKQYEKVPFVVDRTGALEAVLHNAQFAADAPETMKQVKFNVRVGGGLADLTNLEVNYRRLMLEGRDAARRQFVDKIFGQFKDRLPGDLTDLDDVHRIFEVLNRIELDKVVSGFRDGIRPGHWKSGFAGGEIVNWQEYIPQDINDPEVRLRYFAEEATAIQRASAAGLGLATDDRALLAEMAEQAFMDKARSVAQMATTVAARRVFRDVFTHRGYLKQQHLLRQQGVDPGRARFLLAERVRGLHTALAFQSDPRLVEAVVEAAPAEVRDIVRQIADIARAQRADVLERRSVFDRISEEQLRASDEPLKRLMTRLGISQFNLDDIPHIPGQVRLRAGILDSYAERNIASIMLDELVWRAKRTQSYSAESVRDYFRPLAGGLGTMSEGYMRGLCQIGTVDQAGQVLTAFATGDTKKAKEVARDSLLGNVPIFGNVYDMFRINRDWVYNKNYWPGVTFVAQKGLGTGMAEALASKWWLTDIARAAFPHALALYGMEKSLFQLGWHFAGEPTQSEAVSLALMGDWSGYRRRFDCAGFTSGLGLTGRLQNWLESWKTSQFPMLSQHTMAQLQAAAVLRNRIELPKFKAATRREILRAQYLSVANRAATDCGLPVGEVRWETARDKYFQTELLANSEYWLRRLFFYQKTHIEMFRWAAQHDANWQRIDDVPPRHLSAVEADGAKQDWPSIFLPSLRGGGRWDHEEYWVRRYFRDWVREFKQSQLENGEFLYNANLLAPSWEKALLDELVRYFREGEHLELSPPGSFVTRNQSELAAEAETLQAGLGKLALQIAEEEAPKARERHLAYEALLWSEEMQERLERAALQAADDGGYTPEAPRLSVNLPWPVAKIGGDLRLGVTVFGDVSDFPEDLRISELSFTKVREHRGERPAGVLLDDVRSLFDDELEDERLRVLVHDVTIGMESASNPSYNLNEKKRVFWIGEEPEGTVDLEWSG